MKILFTLIILSHSFLSAKTISIYHTSDVHGWYMSKLAKWDKENSTRTIGGFAVLSSMLKQEKNPYIIIDSGDMFQGTPEGNFTKGMASIDYMNKLGYSALTIGNHDYDFTEDNLILLSTSANFPFLGANIYLKETGKRPSYVKPYTIVEKDGKKIVFLGIAGEHTKTSTLPLNVKHLDFKSEKDETIKYMQEIRKLNPDAIIIMPHIGISWKFSQNIVDLSTYTFKGDNISHTSLEVARAAKDATAVFGGHNHTGLINGYKDTKTGTMICESYYGLNDVSKLNLEFDDKTGKLIKTTCELIPLWVDKWGEDSEILKLTQKISEETNKEMSKKIGDANEDISYSKDTFDSPIGNWMTDVMREYAKSDMAFQNSGGIRSYLSKGPITLRDIYQVMPFENTLVILNMTGKDLKKLIKDNLKTKGSSIQISGLTIKYSIKDNKISNIILEKNGKEIKDDETFSVVTNNYLTTGGSGGKAFQNATNTKDTFIPIREILINYIKEKKELNAPETGRFINTN